MLVLSRRERQRVRLGNSIVLTIVRVQGDRVRLGIEAPEDMLILRDELEEHGSETPNALKELDISDLVIQEEMLV